MSTLLISCLFCRCHFQLAMAPILKARPIVLNHGILKVFIELMIFIKFIFVCFSHQHCTPICISHVFGVFLLSLVYCVSDIISVMPVKVKKRNNKLYYPKCYRLENAI